LHKRRILVADDDMDSTEVLAILLNLYGHEVRCAGDGADALKVFAEFSPDAAVLDISMPGLDGREVARRIRATDTGRKVLLIALSGWARKLDTESSLAAGFDMHLVKPVDFQRIHDIL